MKLLTATTRDAALALSDLLPRRQPRVYVLIFERFIRIGYSARVHERFCEHLLRIHARETFEEALIGPVDPAARAHERAAHRALAAFALSRGKVISGPREYFRRDWRIEAFLTGWMEKGYAPQYLRFMEDAESYTRPAPFISVRPDASIAELLTSLSARTGITQAELIRRACRFALPKFASGEVDIAHFPETSAAR